MSLRVCEGLSTADPGAMLHPKLRLQLEGQCTSFAAQPRMQTMYTRPVLLL